MSIDLENLRQSFFAVELCPCLDHESWIDVTAPPSREHLSDEIIQKELAPYTNPADESWKFAVVIYSNYYEWRDLYLFLNRKDAEHFFEKCSQVDDGQDPWEIQNEVTLWIDGVLCREAYPPRQGV